ARGKRGGRGRGAGRRPPEEEDPAPRGGGEGGGGGGGPPPAAGGGGGGAPPPPLRPERRARWSSPRKWCARSSRARARDEASPCRPGPWRPGSPARDRSAQRTPRRASRGWTAPSRSRTGTPGPCNRGRAGGGAGGGPDTRHTGTRRGGQGTRLGAPRTPRGRRRRRWNSRAGRGGPRDRGRGRSP